MWSFFSKDPAKDFNYELGDVIKGLEDKSIWKLQKAKKKITGEEFSAYTFDLKSGSETEFDLAKGSVKRLKTLRHPNILTFIDSLESDKAIYVVTEFVKPLETYLASFDANDKQRQLSIAWGLHQLVRAMDFLTNDCGFAHFNVCVSSVFVNQAGEWKLAGFEYITKWESGASSPPPIKIVPQLEKYDPPERNDPTRQKSAKIWSADMWGLGCLIWEVFNGNMNKSAQLKTVDKIPKVLIPFYCELVGANPATRPSPAQFLTRCRADRGYMKNIFIDSLLFLEEIQIKDVNEKSRFFSQLPQHVEGFPKEICKYKILPQLISAFEFGGAGATILTPLFLLGKLLDDDEYQRKIVPCVVKMFSSTDRATRAKLLQQLEHFIDYLQPNVINSQVFPEIVNGFMDTSATIREITVKSIIHLAGKLSGSNLNVELMKHLARLQSKDTEGGIRTNTTVCLGKIAHHLSPDTRKKVLILAFTRAMRDPFPPARSAGILALAATQKFYPMEDVARRILPALSQMTVDPEKSVRDQSFIAIKGFLGKLEKVSEDPSLIEQIETEVNSSTSTSVTDTALGWAGWAVTSLTSKIYKTTVAKKPSQQKASKVISNSSEPSVNVAPEPVSALSGASERLPTNAETKNRDSDSDYEEDNSSGWNNETWGDMDNSSQSQMKNSASNDGWDTGWDDADFVSVENSSLKSITSYNWEEKTSEFEGLSLSESKSAVIKTTNIVSKPAKQSDWDIDENAWTDDWGGNSRNTVISSKSHLGSKEEREQKRLLRKKEMEEKRSARQMGSGGPMKLGERRKL